MPPKSHRPGLPRTHSRTSSTGSSSRASAFGNLQLTQKEPGPSNGNINGGGKVDKARRNGHAHDASVVHLRTSNSAQRIHSREHIANAAPKRAPLAAHLHTTNTTNTANTRPPTNGKHKAGFTLASTGSVSDDDDAWVSSESGAATPDRNASAGSDNEEEEEGEEEEDEQVTTPHERSKRNAALLDDAINEKVPGTPRGVGSPPTPTTERGEPSVAFPKTNTANVAPIPDQQLPPRVHEEPARRVSDLQQRPQPPTDQRAQSSQTASASTQPSDSDSKPTNGKAPSPPSPHVPDTRANRHSYHASTRPPFTRAPSTHSTHSVTSAKDPHAHLRPHPLIRGQSYGHAHLAPLTITSDPARAQLSASPSPPRSRVASESVSSSPTSIKTSRASPIVTSPSNNPYRRDSVSSARSVATLPVQPLTSLASASSNTSNGSSSSHRPTHDRTRTLSTLSTSSSMTALSSLAHIPGTGSSKHHQQQSSAQQHLVSHFPKQGQNDGPEWIHPLLPAPYIAPHMSLLAYWNPIGDSFETVSRAKLRVGRR